MKTTILIVCIFLGAEARGQLFEGLKNVWFADIIKPKLMDLKPYIVDSKRQYNVKDEGELWNGSEEFVIAADLIINHDSSEVIRNGAALLHGDTLDLLISQLYPSSNHLFQVRIIKHKCFVFYDYSLPMDEKNRQLMTVSFTLAIDSDHFERGKVLRGHVMYQGRCTRYCSSWLSKEFHIEGDFAVMVR